MGPYWFLASLFGGSDRVTSGSGLEFSALGFQLSAQGSGFSLQGSRWVVLSIRVPFRCLF